MNDQSNHKHRGILPGILMASAVLYSIAQAQTQLPSQLPDKANQANQLQQLGSFRIILPKPARSPIEGLYDYSYRINVPRFGKAENNLTANTEPGLVTTTSEQSRRQAKILQREAETLRAQGTASALRESVMKYEESLRLWRAAGALSDPAEMADSMNQLAFISNSLGDRQQAINYYHQSLALWRAAGNRTNEAGALTQLGRIYNSLGDSKQAQNCFNQAKLIVETASLTRRINTSGDRAGREAATLFNLGKLYEEQGQSQKAFEHYQRSLTYWQQARDKTGEASALNSLGGLAARGGQLPLAASLFRDALPLWRAVGDKRGQAVSLGNLAFVADEPRAPPQEGRP
ncbi:MAG: tetratricopeptide repeat protein, partial [Acidobacteriota bacterium]